jgi:hypothetical protein
MCCDSVQKDHNTDHMEKPDGMCEQEFNDWVDIDCDLQVGKVLILSYCVFCRLY